MTIGLLLAGTGDSSLCGFAMRDIYLEHNPMEVLSDRMINNQPEEIWNKIYLHLMFKYIVLYDFVLALTQA